MSRSTLSSAFAIAAALLVSTTAFATWGWEPYSWLDEGGKRISGTPAFFWADEMERLAREMFPDDAAANDNASKSSEDKSDDQPVDLPEGDVDPERLSTIQADFADFDDAVKSGRIHPPDAAAARRAHRAFRSGESRAAAQEGKPKEKSEKPADAAKLPEFDSEFADYHRGARAWHAGERDEARSAWEALLKRPAAERHYRSVWAAYMIGRSFLEDEKPADAIAWFEKTRAFAAEGFADSLDLAVESLGWQGRAELDRNNPSVAARLYLRQLARGGDGADGSLYACLPGRDHSGDDANPPPAQPADPEAAMARSAADPLMQRLMTAHLLSVGSGYAEDSDVKEECTRWLAAVEKAGLADVGDAEYLAWLAYVAGDYSHADRWLKLARGESATRLWLKAKLAQRAGRLDEAAGLMARVVRALPPRREATGQQDYLPPSSAAAELGCLRLARADFVNALDSFWRGGLWDDMAYVAERVLTTQELVAFVRKNAPLTADEDKMPLDHSGGITTFPIDPITDESGAPSFELRAYLRWIAGRRLAREGRWSDARPLLPPNFRPAADRFTAALAKAGNAKLGKRERARAYFAAAWTLRYAGMELTGTEGAPDGFTSRGDFEVRSIAAERLAGKVIPESDGGTDAKTAKPLTVPSTAAERQRLAKTRIVPEQRFHYRVRAAELAKKVIGLLPDNSEELADVLNTAGDWLPKDSPVADRIFNYIVGRCAGTKIGAEVADAKWFVDTNGPWSAEEAAREKAEETASPDSTDTDNPAVPNPQ